MLQKYSRETVFRCRQYSGAVSAQNLTNGEVSGSQPYLKALANYPGYKQEIELLPHKYWEIFAQYPYKKGTYAVDEEDFFENLVLYCEEADHATSGGRFRDRALRIVEAALRE